MDTRAFLEAVWPASGVYCLAAPFTIPGTTTQTYAHRTFTSITDAVAWISRMDGVNVFFAVHTLKQAKVWNPARKRDLRDEKPARRMGCPLRDPHPREYERGAVASFSTLT